MKELMQHLLDGGKLVDERGYTLEMRLFEDNKTIRLRCDEGEGMVLLTFSEELVKYLAEHTVEKLETYEDGFYWVYWFQDQTLRSLGCVKGGKWNSVQTDFHDEDKICETNAAPYEIIERIV